MKLVRVGKDAVLDIDDVQFAIWDDEDQKVKIALKRTDAYLYTEDKKVLDTICGSEEYLVNEAVIEMLYKTNNKLLETNQKLLNKIKSLNQ